MEYFFHRIMKQPPTSTPSIRSIFMHARGDGYILVEAMSPGPIGEILLRSDAPVSISRTSGFGISLVPPENQEWFLKVPDCHDHLAENVWVEMRGAGKYRGDAGIILSRDIRHAVVLQIPRISYDQSQRSSPFPLRLVDLDALKQLHDERWINSRLKGIRHSISCGLLKRTVLLSKLAPKKSLPFEVMKLFYDSGHPRVHAHFPRVDGWKFNVGDRIAVGGAAAEQRATIKEIDDRDRPIVEFHDGTGLRSLQNWDIRKIFEPGDCVRNAVHGKEGFLTKLDGTIATIVSPYPDGSGYNVSLLYSNLASYKPQ